MSNKIPDLPWVSMLVLIEVFSFELSSPTPPLSPLTYTPKKSNTGAGFLSSVPPKHACGAWPRMKNGLMSGTNSYQRIFLFRLMPSLFSVCLVVCFGGEVTFSSQHCY